MREVNQQEHNSDMQKLAKTMRSKAKHSGRSGRYCWLGRSHAYEWAQDLYGGQGKGEGGQDKQGRLNTNECGMKHENRRENGNGREAIRINAGGWDDGCLIAFSEPDSVNYEISMKKKKREKKKRSLDPRSHTEDEQ